MRKLIKSREGSAAILFFGITLALLFSAFLIIEMGSTYESYDYAMDILQRSCNSAVEANIIDAYRADRLLVMDTAGAEEDFYRFVSNDLIDRYSLAVDSVTCTASPPSMTVTGRVTFSTIFAQYGWDDLTFTFKVRATNYDLK